MRALLRTSAPARAGGGRRGRPVGSAQNGEVVTGIGRLDAESTLEAGSLTKVVTGLLLCALVLDGAVSLDSSAGEVLELPQLNATTLEQLAAHTSGLPRLPARLRWAAVSRSPDPYARCSADWLREHTPAPVAPQRILYSNLGYALLGLALAEATGTPYEQLARQRVLEPLGMCASGFHTPLLVNGRDRFTLPVGPWQMAAFTPAGGLRSNVTDLLRLAVALLPGIDSPLSAAAALASRPRGELRAGVRTGLGVMLGPGQLVWHNAGTAGFWCWLGAAAHTGTAVVAAATGPPRRELDTAASALIPTR